MRRARAIAAARRSTELEGSRSTEATRRDQEAYARGEIDLDQLRARIFARYGIADLASENRRTPEMGSESGYRHTDEEQ